MENSIYLIKTKNQKVVPALCLEASDDYFIFAQLRKANNEETFNIHCRTKTDKTNRGKQRRNQIKLPEKQGINTVYIGQPKGLKYRAVVMVRKLHKVSKENLLKEIAKVSQDEIKKCKDLINNKKSIKTELHEELALLKRKIKLASINNERYTHYELRIDEILKELGYPINKKKKKGPYHNFREVPNKVYIKIYGDRKDKY